MTWGYRCERRPRLAGLATRRQTSTMKSEGFEAVRAIELFRDKRMCFCNGNYVLFA